MRLEHSIRLRLITNTYFLLLLKVIALFHTKNQQLQHELSLCNAKRLCQLIIGLKGSKANEMPKRLKNHPHPMAHTIISKCPHMLCLAIQIYIHNSK